MATATQTAAPSGAVVPAAPGSLWAGMDIQVIVGSGEFMAGKTLFGLSIDPGPRTLCMDNEGSSLTYKSLGFEHVDMAEKLREKHPKGYTPTDRYLWWKEYALTQGKKRKFSVLMTDPFSEIEDGLEEYMRANLDKFNLTQAQVEKSSGLFWGKLKNQLKSDLDELRPYFQTIYLTVHMRDEFKNKARTGKREAKGKDTLMELASLALEFSRTPNLKGEVPDVPSAIVRKSRLAIAARNEDGSFKLNEDGDIVYQPLLPPRIPKATPGAIRKYVKEPPNYAKLKKDELAPEKEPTEMEKLALQAQIAENNAAAENAQLSRVQLMAAAAERSAKQREAAARNIDKSGEAAVARQERTAAALDEPMDDAARDEIVSVLEKLHGKDNVEAYVADIQEHSGAERLADLTNGQAQGYLSNLLGRWSAKQQADAVARREKASPTPPTVPPVRPGATDEEPFNTDETAAQANQAPATATPAASGEMASSAQCQHIRELAKSLGIDKETIDGWHKDRKVSSFRSWKAADIGQAIAKLEAALKEEEAEKAATETPGN